MNQPLSKIFVAIVMLLVIASGIGLIAIVAPDYAIALKAARADLVEVEGRLIKGEVDRHPQRPRAWKPKVLYEYVYEGQAYTSTRFAFGKYAFAFMSPSDVDTMFTEADKDGAIPVFVDRNNPEISVLINNTANAINAVTIGVTVVGLGLIVCAVLAIYSNIINPQKSSKRRTGL
ncbi:MAG: DUF3592 domain-containing protein [Phycisphaerales bacterium JB060]